MTVAVNVNARLASVVSEDTVDLPADVQALADEVSQVVVTTYEDTETRDAAWEDVPINVGAVCKLRSDPRALYQRDTSTGEWVRMEALPEHAEGTVKVTIWQQGTHGAPAGISLSSVTAVTFPAGTFTDLPFVDLDREVGEGYTTSMEIRVISGTKTKDGFSLQVRLDPGISSASSERTFQWRAVNWQS